MVHSIVTTVFLLVLAVIILSGKGDFLVAGYNTASSEEKKKMNVKRMRRLVSGLLLCVSVVLWLPFLFGNIDIKQFHYLVTIAILIVVVVFIVLANTWGRKS